MHYDFKNIKLRFISFFWQPSLRKLYFKLWVIPVCMCSMSQFFGLALLTLMIVIWRLMICTVFKNGHSTSMKAANCTYKSQCSLFLSQIIYCLFGCGNIVQHLVITFHFLHCYIFPHTWTPNQSSAIFVPLTLLSCHNWLIVAMNRTSFANTKESIFFRFECVFI